MKRIDRRGFLGTVGGVGALAALRPGLASAWEGPGQAAPAAGGGLKKAVYVSMLPEKLPYAERFQLARDVGFEGIEIGTIDNDAEAQEIKAAAQKTGLKIHSVMNADHWKYPFSSDDPAVVAKGVAGMEQSFKNAKLWGADAILLVPGVVDAKTPYEAAWKRSQQVIRERVLPMASDLKIAVGIEEVWNKFLLSPVEMARYIDEFQSPWIRAYVDVGNMIFYGFPQDWIRTLGKRIVRIHVKDFKLERGKGAFSWTNLGEGDVNWPEVRKALADVGYQGWITTEIDDGDAAYLKDVVARLDRFFAGQKPVA